MSRIGKKPIAIPAGVEVRLNGGTLSAKGPKGSATRTIPDWLGVEIDGKVLRCKPVRQIAGGSAQWGLNRVLVDNMVQGVATGYSKRLEIVGVGYKAEMKGKDLMLTVGLSHSVTIKPPAGVKISTEEQNKAFRVIVEGIDREAVGQVAANIRFVRLPEPYQGKGIRYEGERIVRKVGKAAGK